MKLGRLLLKGFKRSRGSSQPKKRQPAPTASFRKMLGGAGKQKVPPRAEPVTDLVVTQTPTRLETVVPAPQIDSERLTTAELMKPNDRLRQSIEGFLLDQRSPHTRKAYGKDLKRFIQFLHGRKLGFGIEVLDRTVLIAYKEMLLSEGLEHTSIDRHLATLRSFFRWLVDDGHIVKNPAEGVRFLNPKKISRTIGFTDEEVRKLLMVPDLHTRTGSLHYAILMVLFYCGLRRSEVCELKTSSLSLERDHRVLRLRGKGNAERIVVMVPPVWRALRHYLIISRRDLNHDEFLFTPIRNNRTGIMNKALDPSMIFYIVRKYARAAGIANRVSPHSCRATAISNARDHNVPDRAIQEFAGWASPDMITRYDKRKSSVEKSAAHAIIYGSEDRMLPAAPGQSEPVEAPGPEKSKDHEI